MPLLQLPPELVLHIADYLDVTDLAHLSLVDRQLNQTLTQQLYTKWGPKARMWAAENGVNSTLQKSLDCEADIDGKTATDGPALSTAVRRRHTSTVALLLDNGASLSFTDDKEGPNAIHEAADIGDEEIMQLLLSKQADLEVYDGQGYTALHIASDEGHLPIVQLLLDAGAHVESNNPHIFETPFAFALKQGHVEIAELLLEHGTRRDEEVKVYTDVLFRAAGGGNIRTTQWILDKGVSPNSRGYGCEADMTSLSNASVYGSIDTVEMLLKYGADTSIASKKGRTPLVHAILYGNIEVAELLLENGADLLTIIDEGKSALSYAAEVFGTHAVDTLLQKAIPDSNAVPAFWQRLFHRSVYCYPGCVRFCLEKGADVNIRCSCGCGYTPLHEAVDNEEQGTLWTLLEWGADPSAINSEGLTAAEYARISNRRRMLDTIIDYQEAVALVAHG